MMIMIEMMMMTVQNVETVRQLIILLCHDDDVYDDIYYDIYDDSDNHSDDDNDR